MRLPYNTGSATGLVAVTPSDETGFSPPLRAIWVGVGGDVAIRCPDDASAVTLVGVPAGTLLPVEAEMVMSTNTTATSIVGIR